MSEEKWLRDLVRVAKDEKEGEESRLDARWDRLSARELSAEEEGELRALAASSEGAEEAYELFRPFSPEVQARMLRALDEQEAAPSARTLTAPVAPQAPPARTNRKVLASPRRSYRRAGWMSGAAAAAAAVLVVFLHGLRTPSGPFPAYEESAALEGSVSFQRGGTRGSGEIPVFLPESDLLLTLAPLSKVQKVEADCYFVRTDGSAAPRRCPATILDVDRKSGTVEVHGTLKSQIALTAGDWRLCVLVGFEGRLPENGAALCEAGSAPASPEAGYRLFQRPLRYATSL